MLGVILYFVFPDRPKGASWLTPAEADVIESYAAGGATRHHVKGAWLTALKQQKSTGTSLSAFDVILLTALIGPALIPLLARSFNSDTEALPAPRRGVEKAA